MENGQPRSPLDNIPNLVRSPALVAWELDFAKRREASMAVERQRMIEAEERANEMRAIRLF